MPRITFLHRDTTLDMLGCTPPERKGESPAQFEARKANAATQMAADFSLTAYLIPGKRARRYRLDEVIAAQKLIKPIAA